MSVKIDGVGKKSIASKHKIKSDDILISINDNPINDVLDYDFYACDERLRLTLSRDNKPFHINIKKGEYDDLGLTFNSFLIDEQHSCTNKCMFCFVDQMPSGMRETLYFKDDDNRLSFLFGNYITLTNMKPAEIERIIKMRISPINISVHTTNPKLREEMMCNRFAGKVLAYLDLLAEADIKLNCQLVLCNGINDGDELKRSLLDLAKLYPAVQTIACVPVGLTKHRDGLAPLIPYDKETASRTVDIIEEFSGKFFEENGTRLAFPADEFFVKAERAIPDADYYGDFTQLENGVGIIANQYDEFTAALYDLPESDVKRHVTIATGVDARPFIQKMVDKIKIKWHNLDCKVIAIENEFFGKTITVAGLVTGIDIITQLSGTDIGDELILPSCMLRHEQDKFLDNITLDELCAALNTRTRLCDNGGQDIIEAVCGIALYSN